MDFIVQQQEPQVARDVQVDFFVVQIWKVCPLFHVAKVHIHPQVQQRVIIALPISIALDQISNL